MTESDSIQALQSGDMAAFREVFDRYYPKVLAFLRSFLQSGDDAEDVAQNVFVKLWMKREELLYMDHLDWYLFRMTMNMAINFSKTRKRYSWMDGMDVPSSSDVENRMDSRSRLAAVAKTVSGMPEKRKEVFILSRLHGLSHKEIAAKLKLSPKTVENHINLALKELRKIKATAIFFFAMLLA